LKAIRIHEFGGTEVLKLEETPAPSPGPGQVLVAASAAGVNPVDTYIRSGTYTFQPPLPYTPGMDGAGAIEAVGEGVTKLAVGDRVYFAGTLTGSYAEKALCGEGQAYKLPEAISFEEGAALGVPYATAYRALFDRAGARPGESVLVHGASGAVGLAAVQFARAAGMRVFGTAGTSEGKDLVERHGAHVVFDHHDPGHLDDTVKRTGGRGVDVIIEMLANVNLDQDTTALAKFGRIVVVGSRGRIEINPRELMTRDADIRGMTLMNLTQPERDSIHAAIFAGLESGVLRPEISQKLPLADAAQAHHNVIESSTLGKIVLIP